MASRQKVQDGLEGLIIGIPKYGVFEQHTGYTKYNGRNHCSGIRLKDKYFQYEPNPYYFDVCVEEQRLNQIPKEHSELKGLAFVQLDEDFDENVNKYVTEKRVFTITELSTNGFFTMAYPHIFCNGSCDITIKSLAPLEYEKWVQHIYYCCDNRVASHRFLQFHLLNIALRKKALNQGSFCVNQYYYLLLNI